ncbi:MAG: DNA repair protein RecO [Omnitrophica WOR_2 bacterium RBG_13_44_8]|nr:MAG: DNA repair protein RecO [Omnitrophica WOR_2 bacterium RBG_13_44_8]
MPNYKTRAIVLSTLKLGESDRILRLLSREMGLISAVAKGIRKTKSKFGGKLEPFTCADLFLYTGKGLDIILQSETVESFKGIKSDLRKVACASVIADMALRCQLEEPRTESYELVCYFYKQLDETDSRLKLLLLSFQTKYLTMMGFEPLIKNCCICGCDMLLNQGFLFSVSSGGAVCGNCAGEMSYSRRLSAGSIKLLQDLFFNPLEDWRKAEIKSARSLEEVELLIKAFISYHLEKNLSSYRFLKVMDQISREWGN